MIKVKSVLKHPITIMDAIRNLGDLSSLLALLLVSFLTSCTSPKPNDMIEEGVSLELASFRKEKITELAYDLAFNIPAVLG